MYTSISRQATISLAARLFRCQTPRMPLVCQSQRSLSVHSALPRIACCHPQRDLSSRNAHHRHQPRLGQAGRCKTLTTACLPSQLALLGDVSIDVMGPGTAKTVAIFLQPVLATSILLMFVRVPLSWYPNIDVKKLPWIIAVLPTEPVLRPTRKVVQPQGGVDLAPLVWVAVLSFINEILLGPQGILNLLQRKAEL